MNEEQKCKLAIWFGIEGDLRFLSHRDGMRLWERALRRTGAPIRYSQGFNPHLRFTLPLPRNVGMASRGELLLVELAHRVEGEFLRQTLQEILPEGLEIQRIGYVDAQIAPVARWAEYAVRLAGLADSRILDERIQEFENAPHRPVERAGRPHHKARTIDLRAGVKHLKREGDLLRFTIEIQPDATVRIDELLEALGINGPQEVREITRMKTGYPRELDVEN